MVIIGVDAHKRSHTLVACDEQGRKRGERTIGTSSADHLVVSRTGFDGDRVSWVTPLLQRA